MTRVEMVHIPAKLSNLAVDDIYYEVVSDDWRKRAERLQDRRWHMLREATRALRNQHTHQGGRI